MAVIMNCNWKICNLFHFDINPDVILGLTPYIVHKYQCGETIKYWIPSWKQTKGPHCQHFTLQWRHHGRDSGSNHQPHDCLLNRLFRSRSKKTSKLRVTGFCAGNSPATGEFPAQMSGYAENVSIWWRHHVNTNLWVMIQSQWCGNMYVWQMCGTFICWARYTHHMNYMTCL